MAQIPRADAYPDFPPVEGESTTVTPTTTGTVGGEFYRMAAPAMRQAQRGTAGLGEPMSPQDVQATLDAAMLFAPADITLNMSQVERGAGDWLRKLGKQEAEEAREGLRYATRAANREPLKGPQDVATRVDLVKAAAGGPSKYRTELSDWLSEQAQDPDSPVSKALHPHPEPPPVLSSEAESPERSLHERLFGRKGVFKTKQAPLASKAAPLPPGATPERLRTPAGRDWLNRFVGKFGPKRKAAMLKDFTVRRQLERLGWKPADLEHVSGERIHDILSGQLENTGQAEKWAVIDAGRKAENARRIAANQKGVDLTARAKYLNDLRDRAIKEMLDYPLEPVKEGELYPLAPEWPPGSVKPWRPK